MKPYFGDFKDYEQMIGQWGKIENPPIPLPSEVLFACYEYLNYSGDALVIFERENKLYEVHGGHCSCYGLSEQSYSGDSKSQWSPEETSWVALPKETWAEDKEAKEFYRSLIESHLST